MQIKNWFHAAFLAAGLFGGWWISQLSGQDPADAPASESSQVVSAGDSSPIATLDWLIGSWEAESERGKVEFSCKFSKNNAFLVRSFRIIANTEGNVEGNAETNADGSLSGMQVVAWDPKNRMMRSWTFDSTGGFGEDVWSQSGDRYTLRTRYTLPDGGSGSSLNALTFIDENTFGWRSSNREIDGELQPDGAEILFRRVESSETASE